MKVDGRTLSHEASETIRKMAVKRVLEGESPSAVMKSYASDGPLLSTCRSLRGPVHRRVAADDRIQPPEFETYLPLTTSPIINVNLSAVFRSQRVPL
jgi:hypothetical protein